MTHTAANSTPPAPDADEVTASPRADFQQAVGWVLLGAATLIGSLMMDRLEAQNINPVTVPGLLPGLLGIAMVVLGTVLGLRAWSRGAATAPADIVTPLEREQRKRVWIAVALCCGYDVVLIGHGLPFWLASSIYVTAAILVFQRLSADCAERRLGGRAVAKAFTIGISASVVTWLVFEQVFLVRLP